MALRHHDDLAIERERVEHDVEPFALGVREHGTDAGSDIGRTFAIAKGLGDKPR